MPHALGVVPKFETVWAQNGASFTLTQLNYLLIIFWVSMDIEPDFPPEIEATHYHRYILTESSTVWK